jgi:thiamine-monophosphate kinase
MKKKISSEHSLFNIITNVLQYKTRSDLPIGVESMDDCALIRISENESMAVTSDFVRGSGFTLFGLGLLNYYDAGYYLISANLSDLASVGAKPIGLTTIIRYADMDDNDFKDVFQGMKDAADVHDAQIIGGDIGSYKADVFAATAFGLVKTKNALLRKNVKDGDLLCVTGVIGKPITALFYFKDLKKDGLNLSAEQEERLLLSWKKPNARVKEGMLLSNGLGNACQDISDGLKATIEQMSNMSNKTFTVYESKIPIDDATKKVAEHLKIKPIRLAASASVDFELLFTIPKEKEAECIDAFKKAGLNMAVIGHVNNSGKNILVSDNGDEGEIPGITYDHRPITEILSDIKNK